MRLRSSLVVAPSLLLSLASAVSAHPITVDGSADEWLDRQPNAPDLGMIARDAIGRGEFIWRDAIGDARSDLVGEPDPIADMSGFRVTGDDVNLYFLIELPALVSGTPAQVQIAIDTVPGVGVSTFMSGTETELAVGAGAEFLVRTLFLNAAVTDAGAIVYDASQTGLATVPAEKGVDGIEISIPWSVLGMIDGPPSTPIRFSVAIFRAQTATSTVELPGPDALDALTDYGDPRGPAAASPGTASEFAGDSRVDDFIEVSFDENGEVYSPVVISRFVSNGGSGQAGNWVVLRNVSPVTRSSSSLKLGDSETPDDGEGMAAIGAGVTLAPGDELVIAANGANYAGFFGKPPHFETSGGSPDVPDAMPFTPWSNVAMSPLASGDEYVLVDASNTILDIVSWGASSYPGIVPLVPAPGTFVVASRNATFTDTDDCDADFSLLGVQCSSNASCGTCKKCSLDACVLVTPGTQCSDGDACNGLEICNGAGQCVSGIPPFCDDGNPCTADDCLADVGCIHPPASAGTSCDDGDACTTSDACNGAGACAGSLLDCSDNPPPVCVDASTSRLFSAGMCQAGGCVFEETDVNCTNGCDEASGLCAEDPCAGIDCSAPPGQCWVFAGTCTNQSCDFEPKPKYTSCDDKDPCTALDQCSGDGACHGVPVQCNQPPAPSCLDATTSRVYSAAGACKEGACIYEHEDVPCATTCDGQTGLCEDDPCAGVTCTTPPGQCYLEIGTCTRSGDCSYAPALPGAICDDGDPCTEDDACDGAGTCAGTPARECGTGGSAGSSSAGGSAGSNGVGGDAGSTSAGGSGGSAAGSGGDGGSINVGGSAGSSSGAGGRPSGSGGTSSSAGTSQSGGMQSGGMQSGDAGESGASAPAAPGSSDDGGCACSVPSGGDRSPRSALAALLVAALAFTRRSRR